MAQENDRSLLERTGCSGYTGHGAKPYGGGAPADLDNETGAKPSVQVTREFTASNGCKITLVFRNESNKDIRREVAKLLIAAFEDRRR